MERYPNSVRFCEIAKTNLGVPKDSGLLVFLAIVSGISRGVVTLLRQRKFDSGLGMQ